jgi:hypothetical protein
MDNPLPPELAEGASVRGEEYGWQLAHFPAALATAERMRLACLGGQFQFRFDDSIYEMYWLSADPSERGGTEVWADYVHRSCSEVAKHFDRLLRATDFSAIGRELPSDLHGKVRAAGLDLTLVFVAYFVTEQEFTRLSTAQR